MLGTPQQAIQYSTSPSQQAILSGIQPGRAGLDQMYIFSSGAEGSFLPAISTQTSGLPQVNPSQIEGHQQAGPSQIEGRRQTGPIPPGIFPQSVPSHLGGPTQTSVYQPEDLDQTGELPLPATSLVTDAQQPNLSHVYGHQQTGPTPPGPSRATVSSHMLLSADDPQMSGHEQEDPASDLAQWVSYPSSASFQRPGSQQMTYYPAFSIPVGDMTQTSDRQEEDPAQTAVLQLSRASRNEAHRRITRSSPFAFDAGGAHPPDKYQEALEQASLD
ncbi:hypothetical protein D6D01_03696 [Aureobasidium pullulans]|uniref:Uncharacterized protein n=1 Tax=Aureobasidium pullulans TaxID=5580 RepID=A0A4S9LI32_AURPU|nr:hypothetical protein D6D01_03696 [Aureobasidium pullulans]